MTTVLDILIRARDEASSAIRGVGTEARRLDGTMGSTTSKTSRLGGVLNSTMGKVAALAGGAFAVKQAFDFGADLVKSAEEAKAATRQAFAVIRSDGDKTGISLKGLSDWSTKFGDSIGQDDEQVLGLSARVAQMLDLTKTFGKGNEQAGLTQVTQSIYDMAAATGKSQSRLARLFGSIANDPKAALSQLRQMGVITVAQSDHFTKMADAGKGAAVSQQLLGLVSQKYQGQAAKGVTSSQRLGAVWENLKETLGGFLLPALEAVTGWLSKLALGFTSILQGGTSANGVLSGIAGVLRAVWSFVGPLANIIVNDLLDAWRALVDTYNRNLKPALTQLWGALQKAGPIVKVLAVVFYGVQAAVMLLALKALPVLIKVLGFVLGIVIRVAAFLITNLAGAFHTIATVASTVWHGIGDVVTGAWDRIKGAWDGAKSFLSGIWNGVKDAASAAFGFIRDAWNNTVGGFGFTVPTWIPHFGGQEWRIPMMATGGIVTSATLAMIGEAGPEAVIPLRRAGDFGLGTNVTVGVNIDRRRWVNEADYEVTYGGL